ADLGASSGNDEHGHGDHRSLAVMDALRRTVEFTHGFARRQAQQVVELPSGFAVFHDDYRASYDNNKVFLAAQQDPAHALSIGDATLGEAGLTHRFVHIDDDATGLACTRVFGTAGYVHESYLVMRHSGAPPAANPAI